MVNYPAEIDRTPLKDPCPALSRCGFFFAATVLWAHATKDINGIPLKNPPIYKNPPPYYSHFSNKGGVLMSAPQAKIFRIRA